MSDLSGREREIRQRLKNDLPHYAVKCLKIRTKSGGLAPLHLNRAQVFIHGALEKQREETGKVRALILKGRQQGCSTYVGGRFYHGATHRRGVRVFILTHEQEATDNLFGIAERFHEHCPELVKPSTGAANAKELFFDRLDSGYRVGTAGTKAVGRSQTIQLFHGSEVAFWPHAETHAAGILQAVPDEPDTEIILESTANGIGNFFHGLWRDAETSKSGFIPIFVPWFWQEEYRKAPAEDFALDADENEYAVLYGLGDDQMAWRRGKIAELKDPLLFKQEYPATAAEAFQMSGHDSFIPPALVAKARKAGNIAPSGPLVIGVDPNWKGKDRFSVARRMGRAVIKIESKRNISTMEGAGWLKQIIDLEKPKRMFIDVGGPGPGVYDRLVEMGYGEIVRAVNFGSSPFEPPPVDEHGKPRGGYVNRRAEMWGKSRDWLDDVGGASIPDSDSLQADACGPGYKYDSLSRVLLESKDAMRARKVPSPDEWDAVCLTFAEPVGPEVEDRRGGMDYRGEAGGWLG